MVNVAFIPHRGSERRNEKTQVKWCGDVLAEKLATHLPKRIGFEVLYGIHPENWSKKDVVVINNLGPVMHNIPFLGGVLPRELDAYLRKKNRSIVVSGVNGFECLRRCGASLGRFDAVSVVGEEMVKAVREFNGRVYLCPESVDHKTFFRGDEPRLFTVGWVGDSGKKVKNHDLLPYLGYRISEQRKDNYRPYEEMPVFYRGLSVLVNLSSSEGFCKPLLEAAACGVPSVSSDTGVARGVVHPELIVYGDPRKRIDEYRRLLKSLESSSDFRREAAEYAYRASLKYTTLNAVDAWTRMLDELTGKNS